MRFFDSENCDCYTPSFFSIHMNNSLSLGEMLGSKYEHILFHEYIHFLEDVTTTFGISNASTTLKKIWDVSLYTRELIKDECKIELPLGKECFHNPVSSKNAEFFKYYLQYIENTEKVPNPGIKEIKQIKLEEYDPDTLDDIDIYIYTIDFEDGYKCNFGAHSIMEGITHLLERKVYNIEIDCYKNPYDISYLVWRSCLPQYKDNLKAFLDLSEISLMYFNPAEVFIDTIAKLQKGYISIDGNFYETLLGVCKCEYEGQKITILELFNKNYLSCEFNAKEVFKSEIYKEYKKWLLLVLERAKTERLESKPLFSSLLELVNYSNEEKTNWLINVFQNFGYPPVLNAEGEIYFTEAKDFDASISFFTALALNSAYNCLHKTNFLGCELKDSCIWMNEKSEIYNVNNDCDSKPWIKKVTDKYACPFSAVWKTWGLDNIEFERKESN